MSSTDLDAKKFNSLQLIVPDAKAAADGAKEFFLTVGVGSLMKRSAEYEVDICANSKKRSGSSSVTVEDERRR